ncbi:hypothetical protein [uncultured Sphingomonas sp.]|uniref:hypothetical protein n=1 Tax=uncultured Sphingomonas sp. TaxID=158754 RepID=UPI0025EE97A6|nr:hypothetical protein [uncultured Sphingomonas sp.]
MSDDRIRWSASTGAFYRPSIHGEAIPDDAVAITDSRHAMLLEGQATGRTIIAGMVGRPELAPPRRIRVGELRTAAIAAVKGEAARRILAVASLERQSNDNALIALAALDPAIDRAPIAAALDRRRRIDAIRAASDALETQLATWAAGALTDIDVAALAGWPKE